MWMWLTGVVFRLYSLIFFASFAFSLNTCNKTIAMMCRLLYVTLDFMCTSHMTVMWSALQNPWPTSLKLTIWQCMLTKAPVPHTRTCSSNLCVHWHFQKNWCVFKTRWACSGRACKKCTCIYNVHIYLVYVYTYNMYLWVGVMVGGGGSGGWGGCGFSWIRWCKNPGATVRHLRETNEGGQLKHINNTMKPHTSIGM